MNIRLTLLWLWCLANMAFGQDGAPTFITGTSVSLTWNASPEPSVTSYTLRFGTVSGIYTQSIIVAPDPTL